MSHRFPDIRFREVRNAKMTSHGGFDKPHTSSYYCSNVSVVTVIEMLELVCELRAHTKDSMQEAGKSIFLVFAPVIIFELYACRSIMQISNPC